jgi:hypothetical protein
VKKIIGIRSLGNLSVESHKKDFLFFDKLYIVGLKEWRYEVSKENPYKFVRTYKNLIIFDYYYALYLFSKHNNLPVNFKSLNDALEYLIKNDKIIINPPTIFEMENEYISECQKIGRDFSNILLDFSKNKSYCKDIRKLYSSEISKDDINQILKERSIRYGDFVTRNEPIGFHLDNDLIELAHDLSVREESIWFNKHKRYESVPIINNITSFTNIESKKQSVLNIIINKFPLPSQECHWEDIFNFKNDSDSYIYFLGLKNFVNDISNSNLNIHEIEEKIEYLLIKYEASLQKHKLRTKLFKQEKLVLRGIGFIENLLKANISELFKWHFQLKNEEIELHDFEIKAEGSELAYISKAKSQFNNINL